MSKSSQATAQMQGGKGNYKSSKGKAKGAKTPNGHHKEWPGGKPKPLGLFRSGAQGKGA